MPGWDILKGVVFLLSDICRCIAVVLLLCMLTTPCHALTFFQADYDADEWTTETVYEGDWLPLRELSSILPYEVEWKDRTIFIYAERTWEIKPDRWIPEGVKIVDGVTYVTPKYMKRLVPDGFLCNGELYVYNGETTPSELIQGEDDFRRHTLSVMYHLKLALPEDYALIRSCLTGGIIQAERKPWMPGGVMAYIYPGAQKPAAYIVASWASDSFLAEQIAHEAYHVYLVRHGPDSEDLAEEYGKRVSADLLDATR